MTSPTSSFASEQATRERRLFVACTVVVVATVGILLTSTPPEPVFAEGSVVIPIAQLTAATTILLFTSAAMFYQRWRTDTAGGSLALSATAALMAVGSLDLVTTSDGWKELGGSDTFGTTAAAARFAAIGVLALAVSLWRHDEPRIRTIAVVTSTGFMVSFLLVTTTPIIGRTPGGGQLGGVAYASGIVPSCLMMVIGAFCMSHGRIHHRIEHLWMGVLAVVMGVSGLVIHHVSDPRHVDFLGGIGLMAVGTALVVAGFHNDLIRIEAAQNTRFRRVAIEAETGRLILEAERTERALIAHDGRSALLAIEGGLRYVTTDHGNDAQTTDEIRHALTQELARLRRLLSGREPGEPGLFLVVDAIVPAVRLLVVDGHDISVEVSPDTRAFGDVDATREVVQNLLDNALDHGRSRAVTIRVVEFLDSVTITVADRGPGVPEALHQAIFEPGVTSKSLQPCGLGLHSSRELATKMNGSLRIDPVAQGASFTLTLPIGPAAPTAESEPGGRVIDLRGVRAI